MKVTRILITIVVALLLATGGVAFLLFSTPEGEGSVSFHVASGEGAKVIGQKLKSAGLIRSILAFRTYVALAGTDRSFGTGTFELMKGSSIAEIVSVLTSEEGRERTIRLIEGWTKEEIAGYLDQQGVVSEDEFLAAASVKDSRTIIPDKTYAFLADKPATAALEGYLFPDTYQIYTDAKAGDIVEKMLDAFDVKFPDDLRRAAANRNRSIFGVVRMASIVEKEVSTDADRPIVAGIFWKRLEIGMALQSDATVNYVTKRGSVRPTNEDISVDSPYNTYKYPGLPPGPIGNPSFASLKAAALPEDSPYLYFLTKPDGTVVYGRTHEEHLENKAKYLP